MNDYFASNKVAVQLSVYTEELGEQIAQYFCREKLHRLLERVEEWKIRTGSRDSLFFLISIYYLHLEGRDQNDLLNPILKLALEDRCRETENEDFLILLKNRMYFYNYLLEPGVEYNSRKIFGLCLDKDKWSEIQKRLKKVFRLQFFPTNRPRRLVRHKGYRDKGSIRLVHTIHSCYDGKADQLLVEQEKKAIQDTLSLFQGWLE